ncbi:MAG: SGNH/GDSL hydrolase family protein [Victivallaceae bacterium]|nr:SGNH/GDSL hydrolase family protein [Victivallaceae bacterium]
MMSKKTLLVSVAAASAVAAAAVDYRDFQPEKSTRKSESIEWNTSYIYNRRDLTTPRVLLIGDSICNGYQSFLREKLAKRAAITFWASSFCVTDPLYFRYLDIVLDGPKPQVVLFNNGLHSFTSDGDEWLYAYMQAAKFIRAKLPDAKLFLVTSTPLKSDADGKVARINEMTLMAAEALKLPVIDLYDFTDKLDRKLWSDAYHVNNQGKKKQAAFLAPLIAAELPAVQGEVKQESTATGPSGSLK